eukprot:3566483-Rhodomonas_salina.6
MVLTWVHHQQVESGGSRVLRTEQSIGPGILEPRSMPLPALTRSRSALCLRAGCGTPGLTWGAVLPEYADVGRGWRLVGRLPLSWCAFSTRCPALTQLVPLPGRRMGGDLPTAGRGARTGKRLLLRPARCAVLGTEDAKRATRAGTSSPTACATAL